MISLIEKIFLMKTADAFTQDGKFIGAAMCRAMKTLWKSVIDQECLIAKIEQWKAEDPSAKLYFRPKCDSNIEEEEQSCENGDVEDGEEEIQLKGIFFGTKLLQVLLARNFHQWINLMSRKNFDTIFWALQITYMLNVTVCCEARSFNSNLARFRGLVSWGLQNRSSEPEKRHVMILSQGSYRLDPETGAMFKISHNKKARIRVM